MKTFTYNRSELVNNNNETVKANIEKLNDLVRCTWMYRYDKVYGEPGYARVEFNDYAGLLECSQNVNTMSVEIDHICDWCCKVEVKYNESNDMYFINFKFNAYKRNKYDSCTDYKFKKSDSMVLGGKFDEFTLGKINVALSDFEDTVGTDFSK